MCYKLVKAFMSLSNISKMFYFLVRGLRLDCMMYKWTAGTQKP